ncbi:signal peptidase I [Pseudochelatococcus contaminans]|uniref:Signal peptidase I n=1 Tax=Pseudochelatococcus contaminans TaxID=1538103 RepID=A0A7W5Z5S1_9HYPH|nr:signal peptidase I [Pseudochelatococcus contaminans]MBB3810713.1 signal peptidase I [Pseudochelatococcus contaminans]
MEQGGVEPDKTDTAVTNSRKTRPAPKEGGFLDTVKIVAQALLIALVVRSLLFQPFNIPSGSLIPTLLIGDYLFVSKYAYGYSRFSFPFGLIPFEGRILGAEPKRGDVAVFKLPKDESTDYIKRVIGLPGETVQMIDGRLYINGKIVDRELAGTYRDDEDSPGTGPEVAKYTEMLPGGTSHTIIERYGDRGPWDNTPLYKVPEGHYFMMGDNRDNSADSRDLSAVGFVPLDNFVGRAEVLFFSIDGAPAWQLWRWPDAVRWDRIFKRVR